MCATRCQYICWSFHFSLKHPTNSFQNQIHYLYSDAGDATPHWIEVVSCFFFFGLLFEVCTAADVYMMVATAASASAPVAPAAATAITVKRSVNSRSSDYRRARIARRDAVACCRLEWVGWGRRRVTPYECLCVVACAGINQRESA